jgi:hypothetical protein
MPTKFGGGGVADVELSGEELLAEMKTATPDGYFRSRKARAPEPAQLRQPPSSCH